MRKPKAILAISPLMLRHFKAKIRFAGGPGDCSRGRIRECSALSVEGLTHAFFKHFNRKSENVNNRMYPVNVNNRMYPEWSSEKGKIHLSEKEVHTGQDRACRDKARALGLKLCKGNPREILQKGAFSCIPVALQGPVPPKSSLRE